MKDPVSTQPPPTSGWNAIQRGSCSERNCVCTIILLAENFPTHTTWAANIGEFIGSSKFDQRDEMKLQCTEWILKAVIAQFHYEIVSFERNNWKRALGKDIGKYCTIQRIAIRAGGFDVPVVGVIEIREFLHRAECLGTCILLEVPVHMSM